MQNKISKTWKSLPSLSELENLFSGVNHVLFDLDGTLIDSEGIHMTGLQRVIEGETGQKIPLDQLMHEYCGKTDIDCFHIIKDVLTDFNLDLSSFLTQKRDYCLSELEDRATEGKLIDAPVINLLDALKNAGWSMAIVTASERTLLDFVLNSINDNYFKFGLSRSDTERSKPHPDPYLKAMELFNKDNPQEFLIFEDSETGLAAGLASGAIVNKVCWFNNE